jgi:hypothetical protein
MDKEDCSKALAEIEEQFLASDSPLGWSIGRELADFTVAFITASQGQLAPAGTGTLVYFKDCHYILTASHVWEALKKCDYIRIPLKEKEPCRFGIDPREIISHGPANPAKWSGWGPDVTLLRIPPERVGSFTAAGRPFYTLSAKRELRGVDCVLETTFLMGAPALRGQFTAESAIPELQAMTVILDNQPYSSLELPTDIRPQFDFLDVLVDTTLPNVPASFEGVSGGGLWAVYIYRGTNGDIQNFKSLRGVAFWQEPLTTIDSALRIRCHGPQSIGTVLCQLYDQTK